MSANVKDKVVAELDDIPAELLPEVLRFVQFIKSQAQDTKSGSSDALVLRLVTVPAARVLGLSGLTDLAGNALEDTERL
jgi:hypothetical protein